MPNKLLIDKASLSDPSVLADCKVGDSKTLTVDVTVTRDDDTTFEADVTDIEYSDATPDTGGEADTASPGEGEAQAVTKAKAPMGGASGY